MPTEPLFPGNPEQVTDAQIAEEVVETVDADDANEAKRQRQEFIQKYGTDKPRRQCIRARIIRD